MKNYLINYIKENSKIIKVLFIFLVIGILIGIIFFCMLTSSVKEELINICKKTLDMAKEENFNKINIIINGSVKYIIIIVMVYLSSFFIFGENIAFLFSLFKGTIMGIYSSIIIKTFGFSKGILSVLLIVLIPNLIYIPSYIYMLINSQKLNFNILCKKINTTLVFKEIVNIIVCISIMFLSLVIEQSLCSVVINLWKAL